MDDLLDEGLRRGVFGGLGRDDAIAVERGSGEEFGGIGGVGHRKRGGVLLAEGDVEDVNRAVAAAKASSLLFPTIKLSKTNLSVTK